MPQLPLEKMLKRFDGVIGLFIHSFITPIPTRKLGALFVTNACEAPCGTPVSLTAID